MSVLPLSRAQREFLAFAVEKPKPFAWRWLNADGEISLEQATHCWLAARKMVSGVEVQCRVTVAELDGMASLWSAPLVALNEAGAAVLAASCASLNVAAVSKREAIA